DGFHVVRLDVGAELVARSVILALGVQYRRLPVPSAADYEGLGIADAADVAREQLRPDDAAVVVGCADAAGQSSLPLAEEGRRVHLVVRGDGLERSMARYLRDRIADDPNVEVLLEHEVRELGGDGHLEWVTVADVRTGAQRTLAAGCVIVLIGAEPRTEWLPGPEPPAADGVLLPRPARPPGPSVGPPGGRGRRRALPRDSGR